MQFKNELFFEMNLQMIFFAQIESIRFRLQKW